MSHGDEPIGFLGEDAPQPRKETVRWIGKGRRAAACDAGPCVPGDQERERDEEECPPPPPPPDREGNCPEGTVPELRCVPGRRTTTTTIIEKCGPDGCTTETTTTTTTIPQEPNGEPFEVPAEPDGEPFEMLVEPEEGETLIPLIMSALPRNALRVSSGGSGGGGGSRRTRRGTTTTTSTSEGGGLLPE